ncbi:MAG TPA: Rnase Y domain-containing protein, partial [Myxococcaceae bacterium]|nr:Rnase Y domain-containing protein [Myxococcaceae bacterium]
MLGGAVAAGAAFYVIGRRLERRLAAGTITNAGREHTRQLDEARQARTLEVKEELLRAREGLERELMGRRQEVERRQQTLDQKVTDIENRQRQLGRVEEGLKEREKGLAGLESEGRARLERVAGLSAADAKQELIHGLEDEARSDAAALVRDIKEQAKKNADREARKIIAIAIQRIAAEQTAESTVAAVPLPSDEMKGRIIGREGRNIRAFETATGVDVIIDDTPDTVVVSCFDPVRREVGRLALERLIADGRIHPGRIEEIVNKAREEIDAGIIEAGEQAAYETGIHGLHPEL